MEKTEQEKREAAMTFVPSKTGLKKGWKPGTKFKSMDGKVTYEVQPNGSWRKI